MILRRAIRARWGIALVLMALAARMIVPAGFMPMADTHGRPTLVMCSGTGPMAMPMTMSAAMTPHAPKGAPADHLAGDHACPFAAMAAAVDVARVPSPPILPRLPIVARAALAMIARPGLGLAAPPPPKTGPPPLD